MGGRIEKASCTSHYGTLQPYGPVAPAHASNPCDNVESGRRALSGAPGTSHRMTDHQIDDMRTQSMSVSAHIAKARCRKRICGTRSTIQQSEQTAKSFADVREDRDECRS